MSKYEEIRAKMMEARKNKDEVALSVYSFIVGSLSASAKVIDGQKVVSDEDAVAFLKKHIKNLEESISFAERSSISTDVESLRNQIALTDQFLPKQLSREEIEGIWIGGNFPNMGAFMKHMKEHYAGQYDGKLASDIAKGN